MKPKKFTAVFFLSIIIFVMFLAPVSFAVKQIGKIYEQPEDKIDWEKLYPFDEPHVRSEDDSTKKETLYTYIKRKCDEYTSKYLLGYEALIEAARKYEDAINWNIVNVLGYNSVVKLYDGYLTTFTESRDITKTADSVIEFASWCRGQGIEFFYANYPNKVCRYEDDNISGKLDFSNQNAERFLARLDEAGVRNYDFHKLMHEDGMKHHESFYRTDHHWKAETGLWASRHILQILRDDFGWPVNPEVLNPENFDYVIYPEWFLGSEGKKLTLSRTVPDDFTMIYPKFSSRLHIEIPDIPLDTIGDFTATYDMEKVKEKDYYNLSPYGAYNHGRRPVVRIENLQADNSKKLLLVYTSFSDCVIPFLALNVRYVEAVDLRQFDGSLKNYIIRSRPDVLLVDYTATMPGAETGYDKPLYIFR